MVTKITNANSEQSNGIEIGDDKMVTKTNELKIGESISLHGTQLGMSTMPPNEYQRLAMITCNKQLSRSQMLNNAALGLTGEAGEFADHVKKHLFQGHTISHAYLEKEIGDILWYAALACESIGTNLEDVMFANIQKLKERYPEGFKASRSIDR